MYVSPGMKVTIAFIKLGEYGENFGFTKSIRLLKLFSQVASTVKLGDNITVIACHKRIDVSEGVFVI